MKSAVVIFALFTVAMGQFVKVPRQSSSNIVRRQDGGVAVQGASMSTADGSVVPYDAANVYKAASESGL
ncbi:hypothetical protein NPX13_g7828 [Xylaria arbuscula]|uniref:Uncharacterized protein n=1 Tax=Xylaria arbuscula TaxID=114810 RepID=A0A9W8N9K6_9PEZI|nr:hypothetical protein NPX13_g7828 [Xylaria arbuscula]